MLLHQRKMHTGLVLHCLLSVAFHCTSAEQAFDFIDFSELNTDLPINDAAQQLAQAIDIYYRNDPPCISPDLILAILVGQFHLDQLLQNDLYNFTTPLIIRSVHTEPTTTLRSQPLPTCPIALTGKPYLRYTPKANFTRHSKKIASYISLLGPNDILNVIDQDWLTGLPDVLSVLGGAIIQGRELGGMFAAQGRQGNFVWSVILPVTYLEYNFFLTQQEQDAIQDSALFGVGSGPLILPSQDFRTFQEEHLISDKVGIGDLRFELWYTSPWDCDGSLTAVGGELTVPTAKAFFSGIVETCAHNLCKTNPIPFVDLNELGQLKCQGQQIALDEAWVGYGIAALDRLGAILLNNPLGQLHASIGMLYRYERRLGESVLFQSSGEVSYYIPSSELRFFKICKNPAEFARNYSEPDNAVDNLNFLSQQLTNTVYPSAVNLRVHPGWIINVTGAAKYLHPKFTLIGGLDFWGKTPESFGKLHYYYASGRQEGPFNLAAGRLSGACQIKLFGSITSCISDYSDYGMRIGLRGDITLYGLAIGQDMAIAFDAIFDF